MNNFDVRRKAFEQFKETLEQDPILKNDIEEAFSLVLTRFATSIRENRFVVGGVIELHHKLLHCARQALKPKT